MALSIKRKNVTPTRHSIANFGKTTTEKTVKLMQAVIWENFRSPGTLSMVKLIRALRSHYGLPLELSLAWMAYKVAYYEPDTDSQTIRTPDRILDDNAANCVDYTVLICAVAMHFTQDVQIELAKYSEGDFTHVYPVVNGDIVDVVPSQDQTGKERFARGINFFPTLAEMNGTQITPFQTKKYSLWTSKF